MLDRVDASERGRPTARQLFDRLKPGPGREARQVESHQRRRIYRAMTKLAAEDGFDRVTMRKLAELAGVSTGTLYAQFDGKEDCLVSTYVALMHRACRLVSTAPIGIEARKGPQQFPLQLLLEEVTTDARACRLALVEIFGGGPAALEQVRVCETHLQNSVRVSLERREQRPISMAVVRWITAGALRVARARAIGGHPPLQKDAVERLAEWVGEYRSEERGDFSFVGKPGWHSEVPPFLLEGAGDAGTNQDALERRLILSAATRISTEEGYWGLSTQEIGSRAGVTSRRFHKHFRSISQCYLASIQALSGRYLGALVQGGWGDDWAATIRHRVAALYESVLDDPATANLVFNGILAPGVPGMLERETLIGLFANQWRTGAPPEANVDQARAERTLAGLWATLAETLRRGTRAWTVQGETETLGAFVSASLADSRPA